MHWSYLLVESACTCFVQQFDLVCGSEFLNELVNILIMVGSVVGTMTSGAFSDRLFFYFTMFKSSHPLINNP